MGNIERVKRLMMDACPAPIAVEQLCEEAGINYATFRKEFRRAEGMTLSRYYQQLRLQAAERLLKDSDKLIFEIAADLGFRDEANFSRWFLTRKGIRPTAYRTILKSTKLGGG